MSNEPEEEEELEKVTIRLFNGDKDDIMAFYPKLGYNKAIRILVRKHVRALKELESQRSPENGQRNTDPDNTFLD